MGAEAVAAWLGLGVVLNSAMLAYIVRVEGRLSIIETNIKWLTKKESEK